MPPKDAYVDWYEFDHPQLGKIELGGWDHMYTWRNPPVDLIGAEAARQTPFALALGDMLPKLAIHTLQVTPLGENNYRINLVVENTGYLPTYTSEQGKKRKAIRPVRLELELPAGARLVNGRSRVELGHLEGRSNKFDVTTCWGESPTDNRLRTEWVRVCRARQQPEPARAERTRRVDPPRDQIRLNSVFGLPKSAGTDEPGLRKSVL